MNKDDLSTAQWFKSTRSTPSQDCVEVAFLTTGAVGVRDSKDPSGPVLAFPSGEWDVFLATVKEWEQ
ncbi:DUF397 domain-containing protein [Nocardia jejuensis]|uniref:DUF397 domain-containing protein n=1 Tax=Nocardia jejuensis TaxID=328049 RepID=UPI00082D605F|nr:DUF397 domain-containing protein [Nocardia jejuensis]